VSFKLLYNEIARNYYSGRKGEFTVQSKTTLLILVMLFTVIALGPTRADDTGFIVIGLRGGISHWEEVDSTKTYEAFGVYGLPWSLFKNSGWVMSPTLNASLGAIEEGGDGGLLVTLTPGVALTGFGGRVSIDGGGGIALVSNQKLGSHDFGGAFQFSAHVGLTYNRLFWNLSLGYRVLHISDFGINDGHGLNLHLLELSYRF